MNDPYDGRRIRKWLDVPQGQEVMQYILNHMGMDFDTYWNMTHLPYQSYDNVKDKAYDAAMAGKEFVLGKNKVMCNTVACITVVTTFVPLFLFHIWMMIWPLNWWCNGNQLLIGYTWFTFIQMIISYLYALESPLWRSWSTNMRWVVIAPAMLTGGIWIVQCITLLIKLLISGDIWKEFEDVIAAYLIVMGIPHAIFAFYNFGRHQWWDWYWTTEGANLEQLQDEYEGYVNDTIENDMIKNSQVPAFKPGYEICDEPDWDCWERNDRVCKGTLCDSVGIEHPEWKGTDKEGKDPNYKSHRPNPPSPDYIWNNHFGWVPSDFVYNMPPAPKNLDGVTNVDPNLYDPYTGEPKFTYYYPEQWNKNNPLYPYPPYPNRPKPPTQSELDAAATYNSSTDAPVIITSPAYAF